MGLSGADVPVFRWMLFADCPPRFRAWLDVDHGGELLAAIVPTNIVSDRYHGKTHLVRVKRYFELLRDFHIAYWRGELR